MVTIKISSRGAEKAADISQFVGNSENTWSDCRFHINEPIAEADVWFVSEDLEDFDLDCRVPPSRVVFISAETSWQPGFYVPGSPIWPFIQQFSRIYSCHDIYLPNVVSAAPFLPWMINANHGSSILAPHDRDIDYLKMLTSVEKTRGLSVFCSSQDLTPQHRMRLRFVEQLKSHFGDRLDWFGNGINPLPEKWEGIAPYRYTLVLENQSATNIFTEKIFDAYLGLSFPIYWGAPNLDAYFDPEGYEEINIRDLAGSIDVLEGLLASSVAEDRHGSLLENKRRVLDDHNVFGRLSRIAHDLVARSPGEQPVSVHLEPWSGVVPSRFRGGVSSTVGRAFSRIGIRLAGSPTA